MAKQISFKTRRMVRLARGVGQGPLPYFLNAQDMQAALIEAERDIKEVAGVAAQGASVAAMLRSYGKQAGMGDNAAAVLAVLLSKSKATEAGPAGADGAPGAGWNADIRFSTANASDIQTIDIPIMGIGATAAQVDLIILGRAQSGTYVGELHSTRDVVHVTAQSGTPYGAIADTDNVATKVGTHLEDVVITSDVYSPAGPTGAKFLRLTIQGSAANPMRWVVRSSVAQVTT